MRTIFENKDDQQRFVEGIRDFNKETPIGSIHEYRLIKKQIGSLASNSVGEKPLVRFIAYCLNSNHFHFLLEQLEEDGISKFMHRLSTGYTKYFNKKHKRTGALFAGSYKAVHVDSNEYLLRLSAYVSLNDKVHQIEGGGELRPLSSWSEYQDPDSKNNICSTSVILEQYGDTKEYLSFALEALSDIRENKEREKELDELREF